MKNAIETYKKARAAHIAARKETETTLEVFRKMPRDPGRANIDELKAASAAHTVAAYKEERAARIRKAAAYIAEQRVKEVAAPIIAATLEKYNGKPAGPKTREKAAAEIAAALGARSAYFTSNYYGGAVNHVCIHFEGIDNEVSPEIYSKGFEPMVNAENRFCIVEIPAPNLDNLPDDLEAWADDFERASEELEAARVAFEAAANNARRVNLGDARLKEYRITNH